MIITVGPTGRDYTSMQAAEAGEQTDLIVLNDVAEFVCDAFADASVTVDGWTTDATRYVIIRAATGAEAQMPWSTSAYRILATNVWGIENYEGYTRVQRIQIEQTVPAAVGGIKNRAATRMDVERCVIRSNGAGSLIGLDQTQAGELRVRNTLVYGFSNHGATCGAFSGGVMRLYNCTIVENGGRGINRAGNDGNNLLYVKNTLCSGNTGGDFAQSASAGTDYNATGDASVIGANSRASQTFTFINAAGGDYHLAAADAGAAGYGTDLSADADYPFADDFDGVTRTLPWDIGATVVEVGGGGGTTYEQAAGGTLTPVGDLSLQVFRARAFAGSLTPSATLSRSTARAALASVQPAGAMVRDPARSLGGSTQPSGVAEGIKTVLRALAATVSAAGTLTRGLARSLAGTVAFTAAVVRGAEKLLAASITPSGAAAAQAGVSRDVEGSLAPTGTVESQGALARLLSGSVAPAGGLAREVARALAADLALTAARARQLTRALTGSVTAAANLAAVGLLARALDGSVSPAAFLGRLMARARGSSTTPGGGLTRRTARGVSGSVGVTGALVRRLGRSLGGLLAVAGAAARELLLADQQVRGAAVDARCAPFAEVEVVAESALSVRVQAAPLLEVELVRAQQPWEG